VADTATLPAVDNRGRLEISPRAIERIAQVAALQVHGVIRQEATFSRGLPKAQAQYVEQRVILQLEVAVEWGHPLADLAAEIRAQVGRTVVDLTALEVDAVSVNISAVELLAAKTSRRVL